MRDPWQASTRRNLLLALGALSAAAIAPAVLAEVPGADTYDVGGSEIEFGSLAPVITESGPITLSLDASGSNGGAYQFRGGAPETLRVQKPAGATVRRAFVAAASAGFSGRKLLNGDVTLDGAVPAWEISTPSSITSWNHWAEVTSLVKPKLDAAPPGIVSFNVGEVGPTGIDGEILAVIFNDPAQTTTNTVILMFGAQNIAGDTFNVALGNPIDKSDPNLAIDLSLGIACSFQIGTNTFQSSIVNVNGVRLTSMAGGQDDGQGANGALITVGGIGDTNANPPPFDTSGGPRNDDELYNLLPFVANGATALTVFTQNPSNDDNILFAALSVRGATAIVGEGILLGPSPAPDSEIGTPFTATARLQTGGGQPLAGRTVTFTVAAGPDAGVTGTAVSDASGRASFTYTGAATGMDEVRATFVDSQSHTQTSNTVLKRWIHTNHPPTALCQGVTRAVDPACRVVVQPAEVGGASFDLDGDPISLALSPAGPYALGTTGVVMTATDVSNLSASCSAAVTALDQTRPAIACPPARTAECTGDTSAVVSVPAATGSDNCGSPAIAGPSGAAAYPLGTTPLTFSATDGSGNAASCTTSVTVVDTIAPTLACAAPITAECAGGGAAPVLVPSPTASDACGGVTVAGAAGTASYPLGTTAVVFDATDAGGHSAACTTVVTVVDTTAPDLVCPAPITAECTGASAAQVTVPGATATDACSSATITGPAGTATFFLGATTLQFTAADPAGNAMICLTDVTVVDTAAPAITCPAPITAECTGAGAATVHVPSATATDVCGAAAVAGPGGNAAYPLGTTPLGFAAVDDAGNASACSTSVTVADTIAPVFDPTTLRPQTIRGTGDDTPIYITPPRATDACQGAAVSCPPLPGDTTGTTRVTCTAIDGSGNRATATITVTVFSPLERR